jgi:hypothetical protein
MTLLEPVELGLTDLGLSQEDFTKKLGFKQYAKTQNPFQNLYENNMRTYLICEKTLRRFWKIEARK